MRGRQQLVRHLWTEVIDPWQRPESLDHVIANCARDPNGPFADTGAALQHMLAAGVAPRDVLTFARSVAYESVFATLYALDDPDVEDGESLLMLHEELLGADPSGREGRPPEE